MKIAIGSTTKINADGISKNSPANTPKKKKIKTNGKTNRIDEKVSGMG